MFPSHQSLKNPHARVKRKRLNVYVPQSPNVPNVHATYTFVSRNQGFTASRGSHVITQSTSSANATVKESEPTITDTDNDFNMPDMEPEVEIEGVDHSRRKYTTGVSRYSPVPSLSHPILTLPVLVPRIIPFSHGQLTVTCSCLSFCDMKVGVIS
jgi:hypothetical protein